MAAPKEIKAGDHVLILTSDGWVRDKVEFVWRDKHGVYAVRCGGKRYDAASFKKR